MDLATPIRILPFGTNNVPPPIIPKPDDVFFAEISPKITYPETVRPLAEGLPVMFSNMDSPTQDAVKPERVTAMPGMAPPVVTKAPPVDVVNTGAPCVDQKHTMPKM